MWSGVSIFTWDFLVFFCGACVVLWLLATVLFWFVDMGYPSLWENGEKPTLWGNIKKQVRFIRSLRLW